VRIDGRLGCGWAAWLILIVARGATVWGNNLSLLMDGQPAKAGEYKPAGIKTLVMSNGDLAITFGKDVNGDFSAVSVVMDGQELAHNLHGVAGRDVDGGRTFYLDYGAGRGHLVVDAVKVFAGSPRMVHFAVIDHGKSGSFYLEHHFVMMPDVDGVYGYVVVKSRPNAGGEMRTMYRFDRDILDYAYTDERTGQQPKYAQLLTYPKLQDETWKLPDGTMYQKYDYSTYFSATKMWGHYGHRFGVFFIPVSTEYYAGGPLRQELMVHQDALILNYIGGGHYGGGGRTTDATGQKMFGPWLLYFNTGDSPHDIIDDAHKRAAAEVKKWPYEWVDEALYPLERTNVAGQLTVADGRSAGGAWVILAKPGAKVYTQGGDYIYYARADDAGGFWLPNVRPGKYALYAYATQGTITHELEQDDVVVQGDAMDLGQVVWTPPHHANLIWQIGKSDRMAGEFKYGNQPRNLKWIQMVPANLTFTIGQSKDSDDWYFAQGKVGHWLIKFNLAKTYVGNAYLSVPLAGGGGGAKVSISVNGNNVLNIAPDNDMSTYRAANKSARYLLEETSFPTSYLLPGENTVDFNMTSAGGRWNGLMYDTVILEAD
jgi:rhamnogalacturonan endolyase